MAQFPNLGRKKLFTYVLFPLFLHILENYFESADKNITNIQNEITRSYVNSSDLKFWQKMKKN